MLIINTIKNSKIKNFPFWAPKKVGLVILILAFCSLSCLTGCSQPKTLTQARQAARAAEGYYGQAVSAYQWLIKQDNNSPQLHLELGKLYYQHGDFKHATEEFKRSPDGQSRKFLAFSLYRLGNFTDALEVFNRNDFPDDEYRYYFGLTCERLNLFDRALSIYRKITTSEFAALAAERVRAIEKQENMAHISQIDPWISEMIANAPGIEKYPQAGAIVLFSDEEFQVTSQDTLVAQMHYVVKILNERGKESFSEGHIEYDSTFEKVELEYARTIKPDGAVIDVGSRHIRDVSKYLNFPLYSNARVYIISFPEVVEGAVVEYKLKVYRSELVNKKDLCLNYSVQTQEPILKARFSVAMPQGRNLHVRLLNERYNTFGAKLSPIKEQKDRRVIYHWEFQDIPQIIPEANIPPEVEINPSILVSTFSSWEEVYRWWWALTKDKIQADRSIKEKVKGLIAGKGTEEAKTRAIYNFCAKDIRYVAVEYGQAGYEPHQAADIFKNKYGDCKDQVVLLVAMLREAGIRAWPVLISTKEYYNANSDFPSHSFNHCIACAEVGGSVVFLDPTSQTCSFADLPAGDQKRRVLVFKENGPVLEETPLYPGVHNLIQQNLRIRVDVSETITAQKEIFSRGTYDQGQRYWLLYTPPKLIEEKIKEKIQEISIGAQLKTYNIKHADDLDQPVVLSYTFCGPEYFTTAGKLRILSQLASLDASLVAKDKRDYPIDFGFLDAKETRIEIHLPAGFRAEYLPENVFEDNRWLRFEVTYEQKGSAIYFRQRSELKRDTVTQDEYADFKKSFVELARKVKQRIVLEEVK